MNIEASAEILLTENISVPTCKASFLSNTKNKQVFIYLLSDELEKAGISVVHAIEEGDADVIIVRQALKLAAKVDAIEVIADDTDDTDILILLLYHSPESSEIALRTKTAKLNMLEMQNSIRNKLYANLLFILIAYLSLIYLLKPK